MSDRTLQLNDRVTLHYRLSSGSEELVTTFGTKPETFQLGCGEMDPRLEYALKDLAVGAHVTLHLEPAQAFGEHDPGRVQTLPLADLAITDPVAVGHLVQFRLPNGESLHGEVLALDTDTATLDFNHPLAGHPVDFEVHILAIESP